ncbi:hypothetical protein FRZ67_07885 [Panacibacter ginsenosidivorans]|uniref:6-phosphogluconate dehydrogenase n=1 Tax=Panacibacter ginsenosidivorans TaxID=1813871 RepID=A0A5B8VA84_9BACT|nr:hypothetical protein [Panacibacter ginsenosidivorans]QEC67218.1 hypothetical protein FRZ67_07885 [Panacibacter ginsenosidivorans]
MKKKILRYTLLILVIGLGLFIYYHFYWEFGHGTKAGVLNAFMKKGYIFKTYEGKIIQSGFKANVQSNEFEFSVVDEKVAQILLANSGREVELRYKEYFGALPWRGMQKYIVDSVYEIRKGPNETVISPK